MLPAKGLLLISQRSLGVGAGACPDGKVQESRLPAKGLLLISQRSLGVGDGACPDGKVQESMLPAKGLLLIGQRSLGGRRLSWAREAWAVPMAMAIVRWMFTPHASKDHGGGVYDCQ